MKFWYTDFDILEEDEIIHETRTFIASDAMTAKDIIEGIKEDYEDVNVTSIIVRGEKARYKENEKWRLPYPDYESF